MTINTRFNLGDKVFTHIDGQLATITITSVSTSSSIYDDGSVLHNAFYYDKSIGKTFCHTDCYASVEEYENRKNNLNI